MYAHTTSGATYKEGQGGLEPPHFLTFTKWVIFPNGPKNAIKSCTKKSTPPEPPHFSEGCGAPAQHTYYCTPFEK